MGASASAASAVPGGRKDVKPRRSQRHLSVLQTRNNSKQVFIASSKVRLFFVCFLLARLTPHPMQMYRLLMLDENGKPSENSVAILSRRARVCSSVDTLRRLCVSKTSVSRKLPRAR